MPKVVGMLQDVYEKEGKIQLDFSKLSKALRKRVGEDDVNTCQETMQKEIDDLRAKILTMTHDVMMYNDVLSQIVLIKVYLLAQ